MSTPQNHDNVLIFDTTLRDGEQAPGCSMTLKEKLEVGRQLARLGVDVIEAGFPISSVGDFESVKTIAEVVGNLEFHGRTPIIAGLARAKDIDIKRAADAVKDLDTVLSEGEPPYNWPSDKSSRRQYLANRFRILLLIGDDLGDFVSGARDAPENRLRLAREHSRRWGTSWFLLPNPMYGSWELSLALPAQADDDRLKAKRALLHGRR